jgi:hypothetical protein
MNRLVIIGNGFDRAHDLPTDYKHFVNYLQDEYIGHITECLERQTIKDHSLFYLTPAEAIQKPDGYEEYKIESTKAIERWSDLSGNVEVHYRFGKAGTTESSSYKAQVSFTNILLEYVFKNCHHSSWGGFENDYKDILVHIVRRAPGELRGVDLSDYTVERLNENLGEIVVLFCEYLREKVGQPVFKPEVASRLFTKGLSRWRINDGRVKKYGKITAIEKDREKESGIIEKFENILFLNFNYTATAELYLVKKNKWATLERYSGINKETVLGEESANGPETSIRYIHGDLADGDPSSIIFGYGDELDDIQTVLETLNNEYLKHIKSVLYTRQPYYRELIDFADLEKFDIVIYGHSCSNTDRTLLNTLFEHKNCVSIQPFLHDEHDTSIYTPVQNVFFDR